VCKLLPTVIDFTDLAAAEENIQFAEEMVSSRRWVAQNVQSAVNKLRATLNGAKVAQSLQKRK
jgi:hypothetical protein